MVTAAGIVHNLEGCDGGLIFNLSLPPDFALWFSGWFEYHSHRPLVRVAEAGSGPVQELLGSAEQYHTA